MKPIYLNAQNFKGLDFHYDLTPVTVISGPNDSGKTAVLDAIKVALLGYLPRLGKQNQATAKLIGDQSMKMSVTLKFDDNTSLNRGWLRKANGEIEKDKSMRCDDLAIPEVMFDLSGYLHLTQKERIKMIFDRMAPDTVKLPDADLLAQFQAIEVLPAAECAKGIASLIAFTNNSMQRRDRSKQRPQDWLATFVAELDQERKSFGDTAKLLSSQMIALRPAGATPKSASVDLDQKQKEIDALNQQFGELTARQKVFAASSRRRTELQAIIDMPVPSTADKETFLAELEADLAKETTSLRDRQTDLANANIEVTRLQNEMLAIDARSKHLQTQLNELDKRKSCPYCRSNRKDWKAEFETELRAGLERGAKEAFECGIKSGQAIGSVLDLEIELEKQRQVDLRRLATQKRVHDLTQELKTAYASNARREQAIRDLASLSEIKPPAPGESEKLTATLFKLNTERQLLLANQRAFESFQQNIDKNRKIEADLITAQTHVEVYKAAAGLVLAEQEKIVAAAFQPFIEIARRFTDGILPGQLDFWAGNLGLATEKGWVDHEVMATSSQTLAYIGIAVALSQESPVKLVILDEAGIIDATRKPEVIQRLLDLTRSGTIDAAFIADPSIEGYSLFTKDPDFTLIQLANSMSIT